MRTKGDAELKPKEKTRAVGPTVIDKVSCGWCNREQGRPTKQYNENERIGMPI
jgi:hypothetical protein